ncbi:hypothetical protein Pla163_33860 [Planctomycetes bacterium Pla163]|uniref:Outer membrane protein beta-barrel domain-containing protein n=1 Tax=Rohdeia mirabilis TaxID=2528008 RepID=A0A518D425_9BACT|nr:hypothetical protein Pla163_33860 [Planctomycetes bacterium Pla163]
MKTHLASLAVLATSLLASCSGPGVVSEPFVRADFAVFDDYEGTTSNPSSSFDLDYTTPRLAFGVMRYQSAQPKGRAEFLIGAAKFEPDAGSDIDGVELGAGGRVFFATRRPGIRPFVSGHVIATAFDELASGVNLGTHLGLGLGLGVEYDVSPGIAVDAGLDYQFPITAAPTGTSDADFEVEGVALRIGIVIAL